MFSVDNVVKLIGAINPFIAAGASATQAIIRAVRERKVEIVSAQGEVMTPEQLTAHFAQLEATRADVSTAAEDRIEHRHDH